MDYVEIYGNNCKREAHIHARKMSLQLTQQERRDIAEKAIKDFADDYSTTESEIQKYLDITYPL